MTAILCCFMEEPPGDGRPADPAASADEV